MLATVAVQSDMHVQCGRHISCRVYTSNVKCMYSSAPGHTVHCSDLM